MAKKKQEEDRISTRIKTRSSTTTTTTVSSSSPAVVQEGSKSHHKKVPESVHCQFCTTFSSIYQHSLERHLKKCKAKVKKSQQVPTSSNEDAKELKKEEKICESTTRITRQKNQSKEPTKVTPSPPEIPARISSTVTKCPRCPFEARHAFSIARHFKIEHNADYLLIVEGKKTVKGFTRVEPSLPKLLTRSAATTINCDNNNNKPDDPAVSISRAVIVDPVVADSKDPDEKTKETTAAATTNSHVDRGIIRERRSVKAPMRYSPSSIMCDAVVTAKPAPSSLTTTSTVITSDGTNCPFCPFCTKYSFSMSRHMKSQHPKEHSLIVEGKMTIKLINPRCTSLPKKEEESQPSKSNDEEDRSSEKCVRKRRRKSSDSEANENNQLTRDQILRMRPERQREWRRLHFRTFKKQKVSEDEQNEKSESGGEQEKQLLKEVWQRKWKKNRHKKQPKSEKKIIVIINSKWNDDKAIVDKPDTTLKQQQHKVTVPDESQQKSLLRKEKEREYRKNYYKLKSQNSRAELEKRRSCLLADLQTIIPENNTVCTKEVSTASLTSSQDATNCPQETVVMEDLPVPVPSSPISVDVEENDVHKDLPVVVSTELINVQDVVISPGINTTTIHTSCTEINTTSTTAISCTDINTTSTTAISCTDINTPTTTTENTIPTNNDVTIIATTTTCEENDDEPEELTVSSSSSEDNPTICSVNDVPQDLSVVVSNEPTNMELDTSCEEISNISENLQTSPTTTTVCLANCQEDDISEITPVTDSTEPIYLDSTTGSDETNTPEDLSVALPVTYIDYTTGGQRFNTSSEVSTPPTYIDYTTKLHMIKREVIIKEEYYY